VQKVLAACKRAGKPCGAVAMTPESANERLEHGFQLIELGMDVVFLRTAVTDALAHVRRPGAAG
jgi:2-keto-3-deoxy-L-rhamnonate aldolase RhmA